MEELAGNTGGLYFPARDANEVDDIVIKIGQALRNEYVIDYRPRTRLLRALAARGEKQDRR